MGDLWKVCGLCFRHYAASDAPDSPPTILRMQIGLGAHREIHLCQTCADALSEDANGCFDGMISGLWHIINSLNRARLGKSGGINRFVTEKCPDN